MKVKFHLGVKVSVRFTQVSALEYPLYWGNYMKIWPEDERGQNVLDSFYCNHYSETS